MYDCGLLGVSGLVIRGNPSTLPASEKRRQQTLEALHEHVGFPAVIGEVFDLQILDENLCSEEFVFALKNCNDSFVTLTNGRERARLFVGVRDCSRL